MNLHYFYLALKRVADGVQDEDLALELDTLCGLLSAELHPLFSADGEELSLDDYLKG